MNPQGRTALSVSQGVEYRVSLSLCDSPGQICLSVSQSEEYIVSLSLCGILRAELPQSESEC